MDGVGAERPDGRREQQRRKRKVERKRGEKKREEKEGREGPRERLLEKVRKNENDGGRWV